MRRIVGDDPRRRIAHNHRRSVDGARLDTAYTRIGRDRRRDDLEQATTTGDALGVSGHHGSRPYRSGAVALAVPTVEALHTTTRVDQLLLAGEERMAFIAQFEDLLATAGRAGLEGASARTTNGHDLVIGVDIGFHQNSCGSATEW